MKFLLSSCLILLTILFGCQTGDHSLPYFKSADFTPRWEGKEEINHKIGPFRLVNQKGDTITESDTDSKIYLVNFFFTACPTICPKMMKQLHRVQQRFHHNSRFLMLSHSITPQRDSVPKLAAYAKQHDINSKTWYLLTGEKDQMSTLISTSYMLEGRGEEHGGYTHTDHTLLIDAEGYIRGIYSSTSKTEVDQMIGDIEVLLGN